MKLFFVILLSCISSKLFAQIKPLEYSPKRPAYFGKPGGGQFNTDLGSGSNRRKILMRHNMKDFCSYYKIKNVNDIIVPLKKYHKVLFRGPYLGTQKQDSIFKNNIWENSTLLINGRLDTFNIKHWKMVH